jgi:mannitol/fructose-specific phosphotransferase system IIA component (Ntr-type)
MVMVCKIHKPINTVERVVIAIPPYASLESGFNGAIRSIKLMADQIGSSLTVLAPKERMKNVERRINRVKPELETKFISMKSWMELPGWLDESIEEDDLFVLLSAREGSLSWRPGLDRLPRVVAQRFPKLCFITVYPSEVEHQAKKLEEGSRQKLLKQDRIVISETGDSLEEKFVKMLSRDDTIPREKVEHLISRLLKNSSDYSPEMMSGVVVYDAHTSIVQEQMLFVGIVKEGLQIPKTANKAHVVLMLLSPKELSVREHLKGVNTVARLVRPGESIEQLKAAQKPEYVFSILMKP